MKLRQQRANVCLGKKPASMSLVTSPRTLPVGIPSRNLLLLSGDYGLQILLPALLAVIAAIRRGGAGNLLGLVDGRFLDGVGAIHGVALVTARFFKAMMGSELSGGFFTLGGVGSRIKIAARTLKRLASVGKGWVGVMCSRMLHGYRHGDGCSALDHRAAPVDVIETLG